MYVLTHLLMSVFIHIINMDTFHKIFFSISHSHITETSNKKKKKEPPSQVSDLITVSGDFSLQVPFKCMKKR